MSLARKVEDACDAAFVKHGFKRPRRGTILFPINDDFYGWIGLNRGATKDEVRIYPFVGIHARKVTRLIDEMRGERYRDGAIATASVPLDDLTPGLTPFEFHSHTDLSKQSAYLTKTVSDIAIPYFHELASYEKLLEALIPDETMGGDIPERIAMIYHLQGDSEKAVRYLSWIISEFDKHELEVIADSIVEFADPFAKSVGCAITRPADG